MTSFFGYFSLPAGQAGGKQGQEKGGW